MLSTNISSVIGPNWACNFQKMVFLILQRCPGIDTLHIATEFPHSLLRGHPFTELMDLVDEHLPMLDYLECIDIHGVREVLLTRNSAYRGDDDNDLETPWFVQTTED